MTKREAMTMMVAAPAYPGAMVYVTRQEDDRAELLRMHNGLTEQVLSMLLTMPNVRVWSVPLNGGVVTLARDPAGSFLGYALCSPSDEYDALLGARIALGRLLKNPCPLRLGVSFIVEIRRHMGDSFPSWARDE